MYPVFLVGRYLTSRIIPFIAVAAVALCVALVITVVSVMSGFLEMVRSTGRTLMGDVIVSCPVQGIPAYEQLMARIRELPEVAAVTPLIETYGLLKMPYPEGATKSVATVQVWGVDPASISSVIGLERTIYWRPPTAESAPEGLLPDDPRRLVDPEFLERGRKLEAVDGRPGALLGIHVSVGNQRTTDGSYRFMEPWFMPRHQVTLTLVPLTRQGRVSDVRDLVLPVVNEFASGVYQIDKNRIIIPLAEAQTLLRMNEAPVYDRTAAPLPDGSLPLLGTDPARVTTIMVKARPEASLMALRDAVAGAYAEFYRSRLGERPELGQAPSPLVVSVRTWEQQLSDLIGPVENEREMMRILFSIVYVVCAGLVLSIFWAIVYEKTRDIGILRAVGASRPAILAIFLQYGLVIGVVGSILGVGLAWLVVTNINSIHAAIAHRAPMSAWVSIFGLAVLAAGGAVWSGWRGSILWSLLWCIAALALAGAGWGLLVYPGRLIWDPRVYYFSRIPSSVDWFTAATTCVGAALFSVIGASVPAAKAADVDPVRALRHE